VTPHRVIGVDLGGTKILAGIVERDGSVVRHREYATSTESQEALLAGVDTAVAELLDGDIGAIGFGIPSTLDQRTGRAVLPPNIPIMGLPIRDRMRERWDLPVAIENDANAAALAEWTAGAGRGSRFMVMLTLGTGIGGGFVLDGRLYRGLVGAGGEVGHMVIQHDGLRCQGNCHGHGHIEVLASGTAATKAAHEAFGPGADAHRLVRLANEGDEVARGILRDLGRKLGSAIGSLVNLLNPELVVVGGGFAAAGDWLLGPAAEVARREALPPARDLFQIVRAQLGTMAGLVGAGLVAYEALDGA
jgi:glucokinase